MKKTISILLTIILTLSLAACAAKSPAASGDIGVDSAKALLDTVWSSYSEDEKFPAAGGDFSEENMTDGAPGAYSVADASELDRVLGLPEADGAQVDDALDAELPEQQVLVGVGRVVQCTAAVDEAALDVPSVRGGNPAQVTDVFHALKFDRGHASSLFDAGS